MARTASTQTLVRRAAAAGAADGYCVVAAEQTAGHGRHGRPWVAPAGTALLVSVLLRLPHRVLAGLPFAAGLAVVDALRSAAGVDAALKWPNDVLVHGDKLAGLLVETDRSAAAEEVAAVLGLGLNRTVQRFPDGVRATSLHRLLPDPPPLDELLHAWLDALDERLRALEADGVAATLDAWRQRTTFGHRVTASTDGGHISGVAEDVDEQGALLIRSDAGTLQRVLAADVRLHRMDAGAAMTTSTPATH